MSATTDRIRMLNDELRKHLLGGGAIIDRPPRSGPVRMLV